MDRVRQNPTFDDKTTVEFIRYHVDQAIDELASAEEHVQKATDVPPEVKVELDKLAHQARANRDKLRNFIKSVPPTDSEEIFKEHVEKIKKKTIIPRIDWLNKTITEGLDLRNKASSLSSKIGCGQCLAKNDEMEQVEKEIQRILSSETTTKKESPIINSPIQTIRKSFNTEIGFSPSEQSTNLQTRQEIPIQIESSTSLLQLFDEPFKPFLSFANKLATKDDKTFNPIAPFISDLAEASKDIDFSIYTKGMAQEIVKIQKDLMSDLFTSVFGKKIIK